MQEKEISLEQNLSIVGQVLEKLADGWWFFDIMTALKVSDSQIDAAVTYAKELPSESPLAQLLEQYEEKQSQKIERILQEFKQHCQQQYGQRLVKVILFGSQARGEALPGSDIDVLVVLKPILDWSEDSELVTDFVAETSIQTGELISCIFIDKERLHTSNYSLLQNIRREGIYF